MTDHASKPCPTCQDYGWLVMFNTDTRALEVQRCDACGQYSSDDTAKAAVATDRNALAIALLHMCEGLLAHVEQARHPAKQTSAKTERLLRTVRDSLRNALDLINTTKGDQEMKRTYLVGVRELHVRYYSVTAKNPDEAKAFVKERNAAAIDLEEQEYANELDPNTWSVEETSNE